MCTSNGVMDDWFGIEAPRAAAAAPAAAPGVTSPTVNVFSQASNPGAATIQSDLTPDNEGTSSKAKRKGRNALRIRSTATAGVSGLNIPQA